MNITDFKRMQAVYKKILLTPGGTPDNTLRDVFNLDAHTLEQYLARLAGSGLVEHKGDIVKPISWWERNYLELYFDIPYVDDDTFYAFCTELDDLATTMQRKGIEALRPLSSEFSLDVLFGVVGGLTVAELLKGFFAKAGSDIAEFVSGAIGRHKKSGVDKVVIEGHMCPKEQGLDDLKFRIEGKNKEEVMRELEVLIADMKKKQIWTPNQHHDESTK